MHSAERWVAIDFETASSEAASACALGIAVIEGGTVSETRSWLIQPPANEYSWYCTRVHGITAEDTAQEPEFDEVWPQIAPYLAGGRLLAHNAPFDARVLAALIARHDLLVDAPMLEIACTVAMARKAMPWLGDHKLPTVCGAFGIDLTRHHDAAADALACAQVALACMERADARSVGEALERLGLSAMRVPRSS